ncbi:MAG: cytochrome c biogenesis protein CcsA [Planctomycetota bacterium]
MWSYTKIRRIVFMILFAYGFVRAFGIGIPDWSDEAEPVVIREDVPQPIEWTPETLELMASIPMQEQGRIKPLSTFAAFTLLRIHHKRSFLDPVKDRKLKPIEWFLDTIFFPEASRDREVFLIEDSAVLDSVGVSHEGKKKRDRYSYNAIRSGIPKLMANARRHVDVDEKDRTVGQDLTLVLAHNVRLYESLLHFLDFARAGVTVGDTKALGKFVGEGERVPVSTALSVFGAIAAKANEEPRAEGTEAVAANRALNAAAGNFHRSLRVVTDYSDALALLPPGKTDLKSWLTVRDIVHDPSQIVPAHLDAIRSIEGMVRTRLDAAAFEKEASGLANVLREGAERRDEFGKIKVEVFFYKLDPFSRALAFYILGFILMAVTWLKPNLIWLRRAVWAAGLAALAFNIAGVTLRCIVRGRPPVLTLYDTIVFITAICVGSAMIMERINKRRVALATAIVVGALGLFVAMRFEEVDGKDTMQPLIAVLDTNFWLATHVVCITIGYSAGLLAAALAHIHVLGRFFGLKKGDSSFYRAISKNVYGVICFSLLFSVVGTILGGIWANESWGRFWGWDPKENGALLICLSQLTIIHARKGGYIRDNGVAMAAIFGGMVVAFSWWGVNQLGIGLHSYGFTSGIVQALRHFGELELLVLSCGAANWYMSRRGPTAGDGDLASLS